MVLKSVSTAIICTTLLAWSGSSIADEYRPDESCVSTFLRRCFRRSRSGLRPNSRRFGSKQKWIAQAKAHWRARNRRPSPNSSRPKES